MRIFSFIGALLILFASPAMAKDAAASWIVTQKSGDVRVIRSGLQPASVNLRAALSPGDVVATGANGRAMLTKGEDYVVIAPSSRLVLPKEQQASGFTRLIQQVGTMLYKVKSTGRPHFSVDTPMLAAVVKGTTFTVVVDQKGAAVQVTEGIVEVSSLTGNSMRLVEGGMTVYVGRERPHEIIEVKSGAVGLPVPADDQSAVKIDASSDVSLATISDLTDGLVREAPVEKLVAVAPVTRVVATPGTATPSAVLAPVGDVSAGDAVLGAVGSAVPAVTAPVTDLVQTAAPALVQPVVSIVQATIPVVTQPVVSVVQTTIPAVTQPVVSVVQPIVPVITQPIVEIVAAVPVITQPVVAVVQPIIPAITQPVVAVVQPVVPVVTQPVAPIVPVVPVIVCTLLCGQ